MPVKVAIDSQLDEHLTPVLATQVSTKDDLGTGQVDAGAAQALADAHGMTFIRTCAKENRNVTSLCALASQSLSHACSQPAPRLSTSLVCAASPRLDSASRMGRRPLGQQLQLSLWRSPVHE